MLEAKGSGTSTPSSRSSLNVLGDLLHLPPHPQQVARPDLADLLLGVAAADQLQRHVERFGGAVPAVDAAAAVEVRRDADVIDANQLHGLVDLVDEILDGRAPGGRPLAIDLRHAPLELRATLGRERLDAGEPTTASGARTLRTRRTRRTLRTLRTSRTSRTWIFDRACTDGRRRRAATTTAAAASAAPAA